MPLDVDTLAESFRKALTGHIGQTVITSETLVSVRQALAQVVEGLDSDHDGSFRLSPAQARSLGYAVPADVPEISQAWFHFGEPRPSDNEDNKLVVIVPLTRDTDWFCGHLPAEPFPTPELTVETAVLKLFDSRSLLLQDVQVWWERAQTDGPLAGEIKGLRFSARRIAGPHVDVETLINRTIVYPPRPCGKLSLSGVPPTSVTLANLSRRPGELKWIEASAGDTASNMCLLEAADGAELVFTADITP